MKRFAALNALLLLVVASPASAKRRAVLPGEAGRCVTGVLAAPAAPRVMTADATHVYWIESTEEALYRVSKSGGVPERLVRLPSGEFALSLAVDDARVYIGVQRFDPSFFFPLPGAIDVIPKAGGVLSTFLSGVATPSDLETDATHVYWAASGELDEDGDLVGLGKVERARKDGSERQTIAGDLAAPLDIALDDDALWFGETGLAVGDGDRIGLRVMSKSGGPVITVDAQLAPLSITPVGAAVVVWGFRQRGDNALYVVRKDGGGARILVERQDLASPARVVDGVAYYTTGEEERPNQLWSVPVVGGTPSLVRDGVLWTPDFVVDDCGVTIGTYSLTLQRIRR